MDVNGTHFHLLTTQDDWFGRPAVTKVTAADGSEWDNVFFDKSDGNLKLQPRPPFFPRGSRSVSLEPEARRGSAVDRYANWYWIANDQRRIFWQPTGMKRPQLFWDQSPEVCPPSVSSSSAGDPGIFGPCAPVPVTPAVLGGLTITSHHYLVVGNVDAGGIFIFDLHAGGAPMLLLPFAGAILPDGTTAPRVEPFDMAPSPDGGVWILDRTHRNYWGLNRKFRPVIDPARPVPAPEPAAPSAFAPLDGSASVASPDCPKPQPFPLAATDPVAIESLADGSVLVMDSPRAPAGAPVPTVGSIILHYRLGVPVGLPMPLKNLNADDIGLPPDSVPPRPVLGHDFVYLPPPQDVIDTENNVAPPLPPAPLAYLQGALFVVDRDGNQVIAFRMVRPPGSENAWAPLISYLPLYYFSGRALVGRGDRVFYDVVGGDPTRDTGVRWAELQVIDERRYEREAAILLRPRMAIDPGTVDDPSGLVAAGGTQIQAFDGKEPGCVWHRVLMDGCIPPDSAVEVWARAHDLPDLLDSVSFSPQPTFYLRGSAGDGDTGTEIPYYRPFGSAPLPAPKGTWELLLQDVNGRYLQIKLVLTGNGRVSPELHALRIYYPRFSYPKRYLPRVYQDDVSSASFLERMLANMEGTYTEIDGKIERATMLFDARTAVPEALDWLAGWLGLVLDPLWATLQQRRLADPGLQGQLDGPLSAACALTPSGIAEIWPPTASALAGRVVADRRRLVIRFARLLYQRRGTPDGIVFALHLLLDPCLETTLHRLKNAATSDDGKLRLELLDLGLPYPTSTTPETGFEDLIYAMLLTPKRPAKIRIVEQFRTRNGMAIAAGDSSAGASASPAAASFSAQALATAHRFSVLVPANLSDDEQAMITRVVDLEKPAHTAFDVRLYWDLFRIGLARLGIDTTLGDEARFTSMVLGSAYLAEGYLSAAPPADAHDRAVSDNARLGCMHPL